MDVAWLRPPGAIWGDKAWSGWFLDLKENIRSLSDFDCVQYMSICLMLYSNNKLFILLFILIYVVSCELLICMSSRENFWMSRVSVVKLSRQEIEG